MQNRRKDQTTQPKLLHRIQSDGDLSIIADLYSRGHVCQNVRTVRQGRFELAQIHDRRDARTNITTQQVEPEASADFLVSNRLPPQTQRETHFLPLAADCRQAHFNNPKI